MNISRYQSYLQGIQGECELFIVVITTMKSLHTPWFPSPIFECFVNLFVEKGYWAIPEIILKLVFFKNSKMRHL